MKKSDSVRKGVSESYTKAVTRSSGGCCGGAATQPKAGGCCCEAPAPEQKGVSAKLGGYSSKELKNLPEDAVVNSFGCGNPVAMSGLREGDVVLDLGSGAGIDLLLAAKKVGPKGRVIGIDMTDEMVARAKKNVRAAGLKNVEVRKGIIEKMPVEAGSVDWVISNCVINLSPDKPAVFREAWRVLRPGGRLAISDVVATAPLPQSALDDLQLLSACLSGAAELEVLESMLAGAGFVDVDISPVEGSTEFIRDWVPGSQLEEYVRSASIQAVKP